MKYDTFWHGGKEVELDLTVDNLFHGEEQIQQLKVYFRDLPIAPKKAGRGIREIAWLTSYRDHHRHACAFEFEKDRVYGFMFHPEHKESSRSILYNFYDRVCLHGAADADAALPS